MNGQAYPFNPMSSHGWPLNTLASKFYVGAETVDDGLTYRQQYQGSIDEVKVYSRALSAAEIDLDRQGSAISNLVLYYPFAEATGTSITDASGNNNHATLLNVTPLNSNWVIRNGVTTTLTVTDAAGNSASCTALVNVIDNNNYCSLPNTSSLIIPVAKVVTEEKSQSAKASRAYPNPTRGKLIVETSVEVESLHQITLIDLAGRTMPQRGTRLLSKHMIEMDVSHLNKGNHYVRISGRKGSEIIMFIKM
ncbi:MAG TPA: hypothetical protein DIW54_00610 [Chitinophagaceae bacterium]|nr:hypothetical protein [Chitinophagaceae bacterium]